MQIFLNIPNYIGIHFLKSQEVFQNLDLLTESELILSHHDTLQTNFKFDNACNPHLLFFIGR